MARKGRSYIRGYKKAKRRYKKGFLGGVHLMDVSQGLWNAGQLGYINAAEKAMKGDLKGAYVEIVAPAGNPVTWAGLTIGNLWIGLGRKMVRMTGGKLVRKWIA